MKIASICTDDAKGPGHALLEFDSGAADLLELAFFDLDRHQYLWPSAARVAIWRREVRYFAVSRACVEPPVFHLGPEVCNYLQADSLVKITSRDGSLDAEAFVWPGVPTLDTAFDVSAVVPVHLDDDNRVSVEYSSRNPTTASPTPGPSPSRTTVGASDDVSTEQAPVGPALEIDIGMAVISDQLADTRKPSKGVSNASLATSLPQPLADEPHVERVKNPALGGAFEGKIHQNFSWSRFADLAPEGAFDGDRQIYQDINWSRWAIVAFLVACIVIVFLLSYSPPPDGRYRAGQISSPSQIVQQAFEQHSDHLERASPAETS
jgi:hypothetical protein